MKQYGLLGEKLAHSYSKCIHTYIFQALHIEAEYHLLECKEAELPKYIAKLRRKEYNGFNVTIPYKKVIMKYLDEIDAKAKKIGSVNTIYIKKDKVIGTNTDYDGFFETIKKYKIEVKNKDCFILGTGGASLAISQVLSDLGGNCHFVSRTPRGSVLGYPDLEAKEIDLLVNTTPVGMFPTIDESPVSKEIAQKARVVMDIIFNPRQTKFLSYANSSIDGFYMLIMQAIKAEEIWQNQTLSLDIDKMISTISIHPVLPYKIWSIVKDLNFNKITDGCSEDEVYNFNSQYILKISSYPDRLLREKERMDWLQNKIPTAKSVVYEEYNSRYYFLRTCIQGDSLAAERFLKNPKVLIEILPTIIKVLRSLDTTQCPFNSIKSQGNTFVHGDLCLPNILVNKKNEFVGFIDLDNAGLGDCWYDYAWLLWSVAYNLKTKAWIPYLLDVCQLKFDEEKFRKYIPKCNLEELEKVLQENI